MFDRRSAEERNERHPSKSAHETMLTGLPALVVERGDAIVDRFMALLREQRGSEERAPVSMLRDRIPAFLDALASALTDENAADLPSTSDAPDFVRWEIGFDVCEVVGDHCILHEAILAEAHAVDVIIAREHASLLMRHIAASSAAALSSYVTAQIERERAHVEQIEALGRLRQEFLANLSHELKTPLHVMQLCTALLRGGVDEQRLHSSLDVIDRNVARESKLIEELLELAALTTGRVQLAWADVDLGQVTRDVVVALERTALVRQVTLHEPDIDPDVQVAGDRSRLYECVWHLVANAVKFTPARGHVWVALHLHQHASERVLELTVRDTGPGIPAEFVVSVFRPFAQGDGSSTRHHGGLGLGLSLVRHIVELHGASVAVDSDGRGTCVRLSFPQADRG